MLSPGLLCFAERLFFSLPSSAIAENIVRRPGEVSNQPSTLIRRAQLFFYRRTFTGNRASLRKTARSSSVRRVRMGRLSGSRSWYFNGHDLVVDGLLPRRMGT